MSLLIPPYLKSIGFEHGAIGAALAVYGVAALATRLPAGMLYRSHRGPWLVAGGTLLSTIAFACIALTERPALVVPLIALDGVGFSIATTGTMAALIERRPPGSSAGSIMGWYTGSLGVGYATAGFLGGALGDQLGIDTAILVLAGIPVLAGVLLGRAIGGSRPAAASAPPAARRRGRLADLRGLPALVWIAFFVSLYINLVNGVLSTFFPIYGLAIGLSLTQIGVLTGIHGATAAAVRLAAGVVFRHVSYRRTIRAMIAVSALAVAAIPTVTVFALLAVAWALLGLARGLLRVASGALVMDAAGASDGERGTASGVYLAGLDLGKIVGPLVGGVSAELVGIRTTFLVIAVAFPLAYVVMTAATARRARAAAVGAT